jgi:hypothetical protein
MHSRKIVPLPLTVRNETVAADAFCAPDGLSRISRKGMRLIAKAPAMRMVPPIPIAAGGTTVLRPDRYHVMLLQTHQPLWAGERFARSSRRQLSKRRWTSAP